MERTFRNPLQGAKNIPAWNQLFGRNAYRRRGQFLPFYPAKNVAVIDVNREAILARSPSVLFLLLFKSLKSVNKSGQPIAFNLFGAMRAVEM